MGSCLYQVGKLVPCEVGMFNFGATITDVFKVQAGSFVGNDNLDMLVRGDFLDGFNSSHQIAVAAEEQSHVVHVLHRQFEHGQRDVDVSFFLFEGLEPFST